MAISLINYSLNHLYSRILERFGQKYQMHLKKNP